MNTPSKDIRTLGYVTRRTNYGEADRIVNLITPLGKITAIAKGVRKSRSKLAGGVEMFCLTDFNLHQGKSDFAVVTGAKMVRYYSEILKDFARMELAGVVLKRVSAAAESSDSAEYFKIVDACLAGLNGGVDLGLVEGWFWLNLMRAMGEEINLYFDASGEKLDVDERYDWNSAEAVFVSDSRGGYGANEIKMLRLMVTTGLEVVARVKIDDEMVGKVLRVAQSLAKM